MLMLNCLNGFGAANKRDSDPFLDKVASLMHFEGANNGTVFTDFRGAQWVTNGSTVTSTSSPLRDTASLSISASDGGLYESTTYVPEWDFPGDFTVEMEVTTTDTGSKYLASKTNNGGSNGWSLLCGYGGSGLVRFSDGATTVCTTAVAINDGNKHHVAVTRSGTTVKIWIDGIERASGTCSTSLASPSEFPCLARYYYGGTFALIGKIDEFRVTKGTARYTAAFTPPLSAHPEKGAGIVVASAFNPSDLTNMTLHRNNCRVQATGAGMVRSVVGLTSGRRFLEFIGHDSGIVGFAKSTAANTNYPGSGNDSFGLGSDGNYYLNGAGTSYGIGTWGPSDVIGIDIDITNKTVAFRKNNGSWGTALDLSATLFSSSPTIHVACGTTSARQIGRVMFGATPFTYSTPSGATAGWY
jgi:hypothetical protein